MMTESYTETIRGNVESPCDYPPADRRVRAFEH